MLQEEETAEHDEEFRPGALAHQAGKERHDIPSSPETLQEVSGLANTLIKRSKSSRNRWAATTAPPTETSAVAYTDEGAPKTDSVESTSNSVPEKLSIACVVIPFVAPARF